MTQISKVFRRWRFAFQELLSNLNPNPRSDCARLHHQLTQVIQSFDSNRPAPEVLYLGDSVLERISYEDRDRRTVDQILESNLQGNLRVVCVSGRGYHIRIFYYLLRAIERARQRPKIVILPVNMRMFSPQWDLNPLWQYDQEIETLKQYLGNPKGVFPTINDTVTSPASFESFNSIPVHYPLVPLTHLGQFRSIIKQKPQLEEQKRFRLKHLFIFHYTHPLQPNHRKVVSLEATLKLLNDMGVGTVVYITPINYEAGEKHVGSEFVKSLESNVKVISNLVTSYCSRGRMIFLDCSALLSAEHFFHKDSSVEHLNQEGRKILAQTISKAVLELDEANAGNADTFHRSEVTANKSETERQTHQCH